MKQKIITLKIDNANHGQLLTLAGELRIMARAWKRFGPDIEVQAGKLRELKHHQKKDLKKWYGRVGPEGLELVDKLCLIV